MQLPWYQRPPDSISLQEADQILGDPTTKRFFPNQWLALFKQIQDQVNTLKEQSREQNPLAWFQPSYEQNLKLNAWIYGVDYIVDFDANRIGKTAGGVVNALLYILPHDQIADAIMFSDFTDHLGRTYRTLPRPPISAFKPLRVFLRENHLTGDPKLPLDHPHNSFLVQQATLFLKTNHQTFQPPTSKRIIWVGGPDNDWNEKNIWQEWLKWTPKHNIQTQSLYTHQLILTHPQPENKVHPTAQTTVIFKSYDSEDTKWSGGAVDGIMMSEGIPHSIFSEIRQRYKYPAFASWDYTPYEPRNTAGKSALAFKVFDGQEPLPLHPFIFSGFGITTTPEYIMDKEKREDLIKNWEGKPEGDARIKGIFYSSSPVVLKNYNSKHHAIPLTLDDLKKKYAPRPLLLFRGVDPGWGHVTAAAWMALSPDNTRYIYRIYARPQRSIEERCEDIIILSGNKRVLNPRSKKGGNEIYNEETSNPQTQIRMTWIDYHTFKTDENTKVPYAQNYIRNGLVVRPSITHGPKERATMLNDLLQPQHHLPHPVTGRLPGGKLFFCVGGEDGPGVAQALQKMQNIFYQTFEKGEKRGLTKEAIQDWNDDELDAVCYVACPILTYSSFFINKDRQEENNKILFSNAKFIG